MTLTIELPPEIETQLRRRAAATGQSAETIVMDALSERLADRGASQQHAGRLTSEESQLLQEINQGPSEAEWTRYRELVLARRVEALTSDELVELQDLSDRIEERHAERLERVARLARLRNVRFDQLMDELGLRNAGHE